VKGIFCAFNLRKFKTMAFYILTPLILGYITSAIAGDAAGIYTALIRPTVSPPVWLFAPVWALLLLFMGIAAYLVACSYADNAAKRRGYKLYYAQLAVCFIWCMVFFRMRNFGFAFAWAVFALVLVVAATITFYDMRRRAGWLMVPYVAWAAYMGYLNYVIWMLN